METIEETLPANFILVINSDVLVSKVVTEEKYKNQVKPEKEHTIAAVEEMYQVKLV